MSSILTYGTILEQGLSETAKDCSFGSVVPTPKIGDSRLPQRFWAKIIVNVETGCWEWTASKRRGGYGRSRIGGVVQLPAHRISYEALIGAIPEDLQIDHLCRVKHCVNPAHLEPVTQQENMRRARIAHGALPDHCRKGHPYTPENTYINPNGPYRVCRTCQNEAWRRYDAKNNHPYNLMEV